MNNSESSYKNPSLQVVKQGSLSGMPQMNEEVFD